MLDDFLTQIQCEETVGYIPTEEDFIIFNDGDVDESGVDDDSREDEAPPTKDDGRTVID